MITVFDRIPDLFVHLYEYSFQVWAREFQTRGVRQAIPFMLPPGHLPAVGHDGQPVQRGAWFHAEVDRSNALQLRVIIRPDTEHDAEMIARHVKEMMPHVLN